MSTLARLALACLALALATGACAKLDTFACVVDDECVHAGVAGVCEAGGVCSFPDADCPSGKKYGDFAGALAGQCVDAAATTATEGPPSSSTTTDPPTSSTTPDPDTTHTPSQVTTTTTDPVEDTTTDPTATTDTTTGGPVCAALGGECGGLIPCCSPCMLCDAGLCVPAAPETGPEACGGLCFKCALTGECVPDLVDAPCTTDCNQLVWQSKVVGDQTTCASYADKPVASTCDAFGQCNPPPLAMCPDPALMPGTDKPIVTCGTACLDADAAALCSNGAPAAAVTLDAYCVTSGETPACADACTVDQQMQPAQDDAACDAAAQCTHTVTACEGGLVCDAATGACLDKCMKDPDCVSGNCQGTKCL